MVVTVPGTMAAGSTTRIAMVATVIEAGGAEYQIANKSTHAAIMRVSQTNPTEFP